VPDSAPPRLACQPFGRHFDLSGSCALSYDGAVTLPREGHERSTPYGFLSRRDGVVRVIAFADA
jgi:hypothetical protein